MNFPRLNPLIRVWDAARNDDKLRFPSYKGMV